MVFVQLDLVVVDAPGVAVEFLVEEAGVVVLVGRGLGGASDLFDCDVDGCGDVHPWVFVEGVEETFELVAAAVDDEAGADVDCEGEDDGDPDDAVEEGDAEEVPSDIDPAPELGLSVMRISKVRPMNLTIAGP